MKNKHLLFDDPKLTNKEKKELLEEISFDNSKRKDLDLLEALRETKAKKIEVSPFFSKRVINKISEEREKRSSFRGYFEIFHPKIWLSSFASLAFLSITTLSLSSPVVSDVLPEELLFTYVTEEAERIIIDDNYIEDSLIFYPGDDLL